MDDGRSESAQEVAHLWRVYRTCKQMCADRGYEVLESETEISLADFRAQFVTSNGEVDRKRMSFHLRPTEAMLEKYMSLPDKEGNTHPEIGTIYFDFNGDSNVGIKEIRSFILDVEGQNHYTGVFVSKAPVTSSAQKLIATAYPRIIEIFREEQLLVNITRHELVPKHILLSRTEKANLLARYRLKESQLPRIQLNDAVAKYMSLRKGQVVKIIRRSETAGRYASYRWVV